MIVYTRLLLIFSAGLMACACAASDTSADLQNRACPLTEAEIIRYVFQLDSVLLSSNESCHNVCSTGNCLTIGDFISDVWKYHADTTGRNYIKTECRELDSGLAREILTDDLKCPECLKSPSAQNSWCNEPLWHVAFYIGRRYVEDNDVWCWGIDFLLRKRDLSVVPGSVRCLVAG